MRPLHLAAFVLAACVVLLRGNFTQASGFTPSQLDAFLVDAVECPKLFVTTRDGTRRVFFPEADASWDNGANQGAGRLLNLKQGAKKAALIRFQIADIDEDLASATLRLFVSRTGRDAQPLRVYPISKDAARWYEATACRDNAPATGELIEEILLVEAGKAYDVDVADHVVSSVDSGEVSFKLMTSSDGDNLYLPSREAVFMAFGRPGKGTTAHEEHNMVGSKVFFLMALAAHQDPDAVSESGILVRDRLVEYLRHLLMDGHEPDACGRLAWSHCPVVLGLTLIRHTDAVWSDMLTDREREKITVIMKATAAAANYCHEDDNDFIGTVSLTGDHRKTWNPNHQEPYVAALIAGSLFFGGDELDRIFEAFRYDDYMADFRRLGLSNMDAAWAPNSAANMENTGVVKSVPERGAGLGVNAPCTYSGTPNPDVPRMHLRTAGVSDPFGIYSNLAQRMFAWEAADEVRLGARVIGRMADGSAPPSPVLGQVGMLYEYRSGDMYGPRSCSSYAFDGWQNNVMTAATLTAFGRWGENTDGEELADLQRRMVVGAEDFRHKLAYGWAGRKNGHGSTVRGFSRQHDLVFLLWDAYLKPRLDAEDSQGVVENAGW